MRTRIVAVGRSRDARINALVDDYARRCPFPCELIEVDSRKAADDPARRDDEAERLLGQVPTGARVVLLDEHGKALSSMAFAERLRGWQDEAVRDVAFLIGGADGHGAAARARADLALAFGPATWPHLLVRVMLAEQLYRASTILAGHPYHRA